MTTCSSCDSYVHEADVRKIGTDKYHNRFCPTCYEAQICTTCGEADNELLTSGVCRFCLRAEVKAIMSNGLLGGANAAA